MCILLKKKTKFIVVTRSNRKLNFLTCCVTLEIFDTRHVSGK